MKGEKKDTKLQGGDNSPSLPSSRQELCAEIHKIDLAKSHTYALFVIGGILLCVALIFLAMSFKYSSIGKQSFAPKSMEFIVCCLTGGASVILLGTASVLCILQTSKRKRLKDELKRLQNKID